MAQYSPVAPPRQIDQPGNQRLSRSRSGTLGSLVPAGADAERRQTVTQMTGVSNGGNATPVL